MWQLNFYQFLITLAQRGGRPPVAVIAWLIGAAFFCCFPRRLRTSVRFYRTLFPNKSGMYHIRCAWRQYQNFVSVFVDRLFVHDPVAITYRSRGWQGFQDALAAGRGAIVVMSHIGNWDIAAQFFKQRDARLPLLLLLGARQREQIETRQKSDLHARGVQILAFTPDQPAALDILAALKMLRNGGVVALTGDMIWHQQQRSVEVDFLSARALLPELPHRLALASGAPLFYFFGVKDERHVYHFSLTEPRYVRATRPHQRPAAVQTSARDYARQLEQQLCRHPWQWYHFEPFFKQKCSDYESV